METADRFYVLAVLACQKKLRITSASRGA